MTSRSRAKVSGFLAAVIVTGASSILAQTPEGVSPGAVDRIDEVEGRCPTFIWGGVPGAAAYELVVYRVPNEPQASEAAGIELSASDEVLFARVPGGATAWQPRLADGLDPGGSYVWFVRAVLREESGETIEAGDWSAARFFSVPVMPSAMEVEEALGVLRRYTELGDARAAEPDEPASESRPNDSARTSAGRQSVDAPGSVKSVPTATAAIKGTIPDATGETYGVVGISNSPDGAGLAAANTAGGFDLVLDGVEDGEVDLRVSQSGVERASPAIEIFTFANPDVGDLDVYVQGWVFSQNFVGGGAFLTSVDAETLDGIDGAAFATDAEAAALVAAHAASAGHDGRYYTKTQLNTSGGGGAVNWNNLTAVPAGFADGVDNDTTYSPGPGLIVEGGEIRIDFGFFQTRVFTLDSVGAVGYDSSIATGADGLGLISYYDLSNGDLKVAHCNNTACSSATIATLDTGGDVGRYTSIAIGADHLGLISYRDVTNGDLKVAHCDNTVCSSATTATLDSGGDVGEYASIAIGADGLGLISYRDVTDGDLKVAHCANASCSSATISTLESTGDVGLSTSIAIGADDLGLISYWDLSNADLKVAHCANTTCSSAATATIDSAGIVGSYTSIAVGADGLGLISYHDLSNGALKVAHCSNTACSSATTATLDSGGIVGLLTSIAIGADGLGLISYYDQTNYDLKVAHCYNSVCSGAATATLDSEGSVGLFTSIAIGADGLGLISYRDATNADLKVAHLGIGVP